MTSKIAYGTLQTKDDDAESNADVIDMTSLPPKELGKASHQKKTGGGCCRPLHTPVWLLIAICMGTFIQGMVSDGFVNTSVTSIERRFELSSTQSGIIVSLYQLTGIFVTLFVAYVGGRGHKTRWIAAGMTFYAIGSLLFAFPHFVTGYYSYDPTHAYSNLCTSPEDGGFENQTETRSPNGIEATDDDISSFLYFFVVAQVLFGMGAAPMYCLGISSMDENVGVHKSGLFIGILYAMGTLGPAVGYIVGGILLNTYTDIRMASEATITPDDPGWVGAWWIGVMVASPMAMVSTAFLLIFPKELPGADEIRNQKVSVAHQNSGHEVINTRPDFGAKPSDFFIALLLLIRNPTLMFLAAVTIFESLISMGFAAYLPKLTETLFGQTAAFSAAVVGAAIVFGGSGGSIVGGWLVKRYQWDIKQNIRFCMAISAVALLLVSTFLLRCPDQHIVDLATGTGNDMSIANDCLSSCSCRTTQHYPVCSLDGLEYFSPCHAGCTRHFALNQTFGGCSCISGTMTAREGPCEGTSGCPQLIVFIVFLFLTIFSCFVLAVPSLHSALRCVPESQRPFALGFISVVSKVGSFPAPIIFGTIFDSACVVWQAEEGGAENGSCWIYNTRKLSLRIFALTECLVLGIFVCFVLSIYLYKPVSKDTTSEQKGQDDTEGIKD